MKHLKIIAIICILSLISVDSFGRRRNRARRGTKTEFRSRDCNRDAVGAPLDGGLLAILGAAGVAYYTARRKKKNTLEP